MYDAEYLKALHKQIVYETEKGKRTDEEIEALFQPGKFRPAQDPILSSHYKKRHIITRDIKTLSFYSAMDSQGLDIMEKVLKDSDPKDLTKCSCEEFIKRITILYAGLDYVHPFYEANSRTLREFTKQVAQETGYDLDWEYTDKHQRTRDMLYIARDLALNTLAKSLHENPIVRAAAAQEAQRLEKEIKLSQVLNILISPAKTQVINYRKNIPKDNTLGR